MARYARPGAALTLTFDSPTSGLVGTFGIEFREATSGDVVVARSTAGIAEIPAGTGLYRWQGFAPGIGDYLVVADDGTGTPAGTTAETLIVTTSGLPDLEAAPAGLGPCSLWTTEQAVLDCGGLPDDADIGYAVQVASAILWELSGRIYSGECTATVRPQSRYVTCGRFGWWRRDAWPAGCRSLDRITLAGYPVRSIEEVRIDGVVLDPSEYVLLGRRHLVRRDAYTSWWPSCQYVERPLTDEGTFGITYTYGADPPLSGIYAATALAREVVKSCAGGPCALPSNVSRVLRQGVEATIDASKAASKGLGLAEVAAFLGATPRPRRRTAIVSPDSRRYPLVIDNPE